MTNRSHNLLGFGISLGVFHLVNNWEHNHGRKVAWWSRHPIVALLLAISIAWVVLGVIFGVVDYAQGTVNHPITAYRLLTTVGLPLYAVYLFGVGITPVGCLIFGIPALLFGIKRYRLADIRWADPARPYNPNVYDSTAIERHPDSLAPWLDGR